MKGARSNVVTWPSGLRRWFKAPVSSEAWVRIPPLPNFFFSPPKKLSRNYVACYIKRPVRIFSLLLHALPYRKFDNANRQAEFPTACFGIVFPYIVLFFLFLSFSLSPRCARRFTPWSIRNAEVSFCSTQWPRF